MIEVAECPICKNKNLQKFTTCEDYTVSHETFHVKQCVQCNLGITTPRPETVKLGSYYQSEEYISHSGRSSGGIGFVYKLARSFSLKWKRAKILRNKTEGSILDFGCGTGDFLNTMQNSGWSVTGVEPSADARLKAEILTSIKINASVDELRSRIAEIPTDRQIAVYCQVGQHGYLATRILRQKGFTAVNIGGGYKTYRLINDGRSAGR